MSNTVRTTGMSEPRDLEEELWAVFGRLEEIQEVPERARLELDTLKMVLETRKAGEKANASKVTGDTSLEQARAKANGGKTR